MNYSNSIDAMRTHGAIATRCLRGVALSILGLSLLSACGSGDNDSSSAETVVFETAQITREPQVLTGDPTSGRCADSTQPCFDGKSDFLNGQRKMLRVDDIAVFTQNISPPSKLLIHFKTLNTSDSNVAALTNVADTYVLANPLTAFVGARVWNLNQDVAITVAWSTEADSGPTMNVYANGNFLPDNNPILRFNTNGRGLKLATADFTGDGFDDVVFFMGDNFVVASAKDLNSVSAGLRYGPGLTSNAPYAVAVGNFFGTGPVVAAVNTSGQNPQTFELRFFSVDPKTLAITQMPEKTLQLSLPDTPLSDSSLTQLVAGRFSNTAYDQLVLSYSTASNGGFVTIDFDAKGMPIQRATVPGFDGRRTFALLRTGRFDPSSNFDGVAYQIMYSVGGGSVEILTFDANLNMLFDHNNFQSMDQGRSNYDTQVGNFDRMQPDPARPGQKIRNPGLQVATLSSTNERPCVIDIFSVNVVSGRKPGSQFSFSTNTNHDYDIPNCKRFQSGSLAALDLQGRSLTLGAPSVVTIENKAQPTVVLAVPPMHADFIAGKLTNFTAAPGGFFTSYKTSDGSDASASSTSTTSWTFAAKETFDAKFASGDCDLGTCESFENKSSAKQALDGSTKALSGSFSSSSLNISQQTGFYDVLWYEDKALTVFIYPVIGKTVCPASKPNCTDAEKVPMTVMFAGPDSVNQSKVDSISAPWYQPPWMPGNLLSYPGTLGQLQAAAFDDPSSFDPLTAVNRWRTDTSDAEETASWTEGGKGGSTTSLNQNYSFKNTMTLSGKFGVTGAVTFEGSTKLSLSGSVGFSNLTDVLTTMTQSTGIGFTKNAVFPDPNRYGYYVTPYIFGQKPPTADHLLPPLTTDVKTFGILQSGYVVDPLSAGTIWRETYGVAPDIALNQPARWRIVTASTDPADGTCVSTRALSQVDCAVLGDKSPQDPWADEYHWMRGFFITGAEANGTGPQLGSANGGDALLLQARVHNFSTAAMPAGAIVRVRFHAMPWNTNLNKPAGASFVIGTSVLGAVPPFNTTSDTPNWLLAGQRWETTGLDGKDFVFWVATWMEDATGKLIGELPGKGLSAVPAAGIDYAAMVALEQEHGNNVGLYNQVFHIYPKATVPRPVVAPATAPSVVITHVGSEAQSIPRNQRTMVAARLRTGVNDLTRGLTVRFYDGDPKEGAPIVGMQTLPHLRAGETHDFRVPFRSSECGAHVLHVVAGAGTRFEHTAKLSPINVACS